MSSIPTNIDEAIIELGKIIPAEDQAAIARMSEDDVGMLHHSLGQWIRNSWGLWSGSTLLDHMKSLGFIHADDMSSSIIREYWARVKGLPSSINEDIEKYNKFWKTLESKRSSNL